MSTTDTTPTDDVAPDEDAQEQQPDELEADDENAGAQDGDAVKAANRQAAGYRRKLRDAEQANATLTSRLSRYETSEFERMAAAAGAASIDDLMLVTDLAELRDAEGNLSDELAGAHLAKLRQDRPHWFARRPTSTDYGGGVGRPARGAKPRGLGAVLRPK